METRCILKVSVEAGKLAMLQIQYHKRAAQESGLKKMVEKRIGSAYKTQGKIQSVARYVSFKEIISVCKEN